MSRNKFTPFDVGGPDDFAAEFRRAIQIVFSARRTFRFLITARLSDSIDDVALALQRAVDTIYEELQ